VRTADANCLELGRFESGVKQMAETNAVNHECLLLMAHGSKNANWLIPFQQLAEGLKKALGEKCVHLCYMEFASPTLEEMTQQLYTEGARHVRLLPLFLAKGSHLCQDVPAQLAQLKAKFPDLVIDLLPPIGENPHFAKSLHSVVKGYILPSLT
jgi:sirohydrochlorin cobaltochelatase